MTTECFTAWLIHKQAIGNTSSRLTVFTQEKGIIHCLFRGGRALKKQAALQLFLPLWIEIDSRAYGQYIRQLECQGVIPLFASTNLFAALYINELIYHTIKPNDAQPELYESYQYTMQALPSITDRLAIEAVLRRFEWQLLYACGVLCSFEKEAHTNQSIDATQFYKYLPARGFIASAQGLPGCDILALAQDQLNTPQILKTAKIIMRQAINYLLAGKELKSRSLFKKQVPNN